MQWGLNSLAVLLMLEALDVGLDTGLQALSAFAPLEGRGVETTIAMKDGEFTLIDDSFNANSLSMIAALKTLGARRAAGRRMVALTDMLELGEMSAGLHAALARADHGGQGRPGVLRRSDDAVSVGSASSELAAAATRTARPSSSPGLVEAVRPGDVVLVKGSKGSKAGALAKALAGLGVGEMG